MKKRYITIVLIILLLSVSLYSQEKKKTYRDYKIWYTDGTDEIVKEVQCLVITDDEYRFHHANYNEVTIIMKNVIKKYKVVKTYTK